MLVEINQGKTPQYLPIGSLKLFGSNPQGDAIFRVVWSDSITYVVGAAHLKDDFYTAKELELAGKTDDVREVGYKQLPYYPNIHAWVLERWLSPLAFTGCTAQQYHENYTDPVTGLLTLGPYPDRGVYEQSFVFPSEPTRTTVEGVIRRIMAGWDYSFAQHRAATREAAENREKAQFERTKDIFLDSQQAFKNRPTNIRPGKRTKERIPLRYSAEELRLRRRVGFATGSPKS